MYLTVIKFWLIFQFFKTPGNDVLRFLILRATDGLGLVLSLYVTHQPFLSSSTGSFFCNYNGGEQIYSGNLVIVSWNYKVLLILHPAGLKSLSCSNAVEGIGFLYFEVNFLFLGISGSGSSAKILLIVLKLPWKPFLWHL